ncbi:Hmgcs1 [Symbiodinium natans]|uniref:Hmgcs1 protein n=1 Tax=Symbiodinium natans TaxID=878477 RepID=A0A812PCH1_9DINO|nr:Hmgcs1 [Symbiodinium natans]
MSELELMAQLGALLRPDEPVEELFRSFPGSGRFHSGLMPDLATYGALKAPEAGLFVEYDGHPCHQQRYGDKRDRAKNAALLSLAPDSWVVRISHGDRQPMGRNVLSVKVNFWQGESDQSLTRTLSEVIQQMLSGLRSELDPGVALRLLQHQASNRLCPKAKEFAEAALRDCRIRAKSPHDASQETPGPPRPARSYANL